MRRRESLGWGLVGGLSFLVLAQGFELVAAVRLGLATKAAVALAVAGATVLLAPRVERRLPDNGSA